MNFFKRFTLIATAVSMYGAIAAQAVQRVEAEVGPGNGATKKQLAVSYILAAAHAGESVDIPQVQAIASAVELAAGIANALGVFGTPKGSTVSVPAAATEPVKV